MAYAGEAQRPAEPCPTKLDLTRLLALSLASLSVLRGLVGAGRCERNKMITFRPMGSGEYSAYLDYFIPDYAAEIVSNYGLSQADALAQARREIARDLPEGPQTSGEIMLCILLHVEGVESVIGYFWYTPDLAGRSVFIKDFYIGDARQGQGLGKQALAALETVLALEGFQQIKLRVAGDNGRARHVYEKTGFRVTGINMNKVIGRDGA